MFNLTIFTIALVVIAAVLIVLDVAEYFALKNVPATAPLTGWDEGTPNTAPAMSMVTDEDIARAAMLDQLYYMDGGK